MDNEQQFEQLRTLAKDCNMPHQRLFDKLCQQAMMKQYIAKNLGLQFSDNNCEALYQKYAVVAKKAKSKVSAYDVFKTNGYAELRSNYYPHPFIVDKCRGIYTSYVDGRALTTPVDIQEALGIDWRHEASYHWISDLRYDACTVHCREQHKETMHARNIDDLSRCDRYLAIWFSDSSSLFYHNGKYIPNVIDLFIKQLLKYNPYSLAVSYYSYDSAEKYFHDEFSHTVRNAVLLFEEDDCTVQLFQQLHTLYAQVAELCEYMASSRAALNIVYRADEVRDNMQKKALQYKLVQQLKQQGELQ